MTTHPVAARCPRCGGTRRTPIVYGMPDDRLLEAARRGEVVIGGCVVTAAMPMWRCRSCGCTGDDGEGHGTGAPT